MKLSTRARYGTRALIEVALTHNQHPLRLKTIAQSQQIPLHYLEHIIAPLISAGILRSTRGAKGGISLARPPHEISLNEVIQALEGSLAPVGCVDNPEACPRADLCATHDIWAKIKGAVDGVLESTTLQDLVEQQEDKNRL